jgi:hypothetical protein
VSGGCGGGSSASTANSTSASANTVELHVERADLVIASRELARAEGSFRDEAAVARRAWPYIAHGLPSRVSPTAKLAVAAAAASVVRMAQPPFTAKANELTGPASGIAALARSFRGLAQHGWTLVDAAITGVERASPANARFLRANAGLYVGSIYDGHYALAAIGHTLQKAYVKLGGPSAFGATLTQSEIDGLQRAYSPGALRLEPAPPKSLGA